MKNVKKIENENSKTPKTNNQITPACKLIRMNAIQK